MSTRSPSLVAVAAAEPARADADVADLDVPPGQVGRVVGVQAEVLAERAQVAAVHRQPDFLDAC